MKTFLMLLIGISIISISRLAISGVSSYQCEVISDATLEKDGTLKMHPKSLNIGKKFAIDRKTGVLIGDVFFGWGDPKVIASGSKDNAFKVLWTKKAGGTNGVFIDYLSIEEFNQGIKKPFSYFTGSQITTGFCE